MDRETIIASKIDENTQFHKDGEPLIDALLYIGAVGLNPKQNLITIYSNRGLSDVLANPQTLDSQGRPASKIWIPGKYSIQVDDLNGIQVFQDLDAGVVADTGTTSLTNVQGTNAITAEGNPTITAYVANEIYLLKAANANTGAMTVKFDTADTISIKKNHNQAMIKGDVEQNQAMMFQYNATDDVMEIVNLNAKIVRFTAGADIAAAATVNLTNATGNVISITGSTGPITAFTTNVGDLYWLTFASIPQITHNGTTLKMPGEANRTMVAGDRILVKGISGGSEVVFIAKKDGTPIAMFPAATQAQQETSTSILVPVTPGRQQFHPSAAKAWVRFDGTGTINIDASYNVTSLDDNGVGLYAVNVDTDFSSINYVGIGIATRESAAGPLIVTGRRLDSPTAGRFPIDIFNTSQSLEDSDEIYFAFFGDQ